MKSSLLCLTYFSDNSSVGIESSCNIADPGSIPGSGRSPGEGKVYPLQYPVPENSMDYTVHGILSARILEWVAFPFSRETSQPRDQTQSPTLQADSLAAEPQGKPKNTGVGSLSLLQGIFLTQESNTCLLHCRWIFYQLSQREAQEHWSG